MAELFAEYYRIYGKGLVCVQEVFPMDCLDLFVDFIGVFGIEVFDGFQDADGRTQAEVCFVHHCLVSTEGHHAATYFNVVGSQCCKFLCQYFFQSLEGFGNHFERLFAHLFIWYFDYLLYYMF